MSTGPQAPRDPDLGVGDRIRVSGGYSPWPEWLNETAGKESAGTERTGVVIAFIPGSGERRAAVVELDEPVDAVMPSDADPARRVRGRYLVLSLRYADARWARRETVHIEVCDFVPDTKPRNDRRLGVWVESHATYERLDEGAPRS